MNTTNILTRSGTLPSRSSRRTARQGRLTDGDVGNKACDRRLEREILPFRSKSVDILKQWRYYVTIISSVALFFSVDGR
jgi:hypothetical protein